MRRLFLAVLTLTFVFQVQAELPIKTSAAGDSITMGFGADCTRNTSFWDLFCLLGGDQPEHSWFDGWSSNVNSVHDKYKVLDGTIAANKSAAESGSEMGGGSNNFAVQAANIAAQNPVPDHVEVLLGGNDICNRDCTNPANCTNPLFTDAQWRASVQAGLNTLMTSMPVGGTVFLGSVPRIQDLRPAGLAKEATSSRINCQNIWSDHDICNIATSGALMSGEAVDDRRAVIAATQKRYNTILAEEATAYNSNSNGKNPNGLEVVADYQGEAVVSAGTLAFGADDIDGGDCFHPSILGQNKVANTLWDNNPDKL
jgi:lysophospholipase L1-like esterase